MYCEDTKRQFIESLLTKDEINTLIKKSFEAAETARAPYSNFFVGSSILTTDGQYYLGANIETMTMNYTVHAEMCAVGKAVNDGKRKLKALACIATTPNYDYFITCCGECRNFLVNYNSFLPVFFLHQSGAVVYKLLHELLPYSYSKSDLAITNHEDLSSKYGYTIAKANKWILEDTCWQSQNDLSKMLKEWKLDELYNYINKNIQFKIDGSLQGKFFGGSNALNFNTVQYIAQAYAEHLKAQNDKIEEKHIFIGYANEQCQQFAERILATLVHNNINTEVTQRSFTELKALAEKFDDTIGLIQVDVNSENCYTIKFTKANGEGISTQDQDRIMEIRDNINKLDNLKEVYDYNNYKFKKIKKHYIL